MRVFGTDAADGVTFKGLRVEREMEHQYVEVSHYPDCGLLCAASLASSPCWNLARGPSFPTLTNLELANAKGFVMTTLFTSDHEWLRIEGDVATIGVTDYAQS